MEKITKKYSLSNRKKAIAFLCAFALVFLSVLAPAYAVESIRLPALGSKLIPLGRTTGITLFSEGAVVVGFSVPENSGGVSPALTAGLAMGDVIIKVNGIAVNSNESLENALSKAQKGPVEITIKRNGQIKTLSVAAVYNESLGKLQIGAWVRDSMAGIGTITFVDPQTGVFGALGHGVSDVDTGQLMQVSSGDLMPSLVASVIKGKTGTPGELCGSFDMTKTQGQLFFNSPRGVFGKLSDAGIYQDGKALKTVPKSEITTGKAFIIANVENDICRQYEIQIIRIYMSDDPSMRDMMVQVTDPLLLEKTGGIVQGMSGSPIIQNGNLVGAVTHVLVNDPTRGYAISIERMLENKDK